MYTHRCTTPNPAATGGPYCRVLFTCRNAYGQTIARVQFSRGYRATVLLADLEKVTP